MSRKTFWKQLAIFLTWRIGLFVVGAVAPLFLRYQGSFSYTETLKNFQLPLWIAHWGGFDGVHYILIAQMGYLQLNFVQAFFPLFPEVLLRPLFLYIPHFNVLLAGLLFTNLFAFGFLCAWFLFLKMIKNERVAWYGVFAFLLFPTSFFLGAMYTESLFLLLAVGAFWFSAKKKWWFAALCVALASATRVIGIFLVPAIWLEIWQSDHYVPVFTFLKKEWQKLAIISLGAVGLLGYMLFLYLNFHDPLYFFHVQTAFGGGRQQSFVLYPQVVWRYIKILLTSRPLDFRYYASVQEFIVGVLGLIGILWSFRYTRASLAFFSLAVFLLPTLTGTFSSMPRYMLACLSFFVMSALIGEKHPKFFWIFAVIQTAFLILNTALFIQGYWVA